MKTDIFIRTYKGDAHWLSYCLRSIKKFCTEFGELVIVCPADSEYLIRPLAEEYGAKFFTCPRLHADDYMGQQATKMMADTWCNGDAICFVDSDVVFTRPVTPADIITDNKIVLLKTAYSEIECPWQKYTEQATGLPVEFEYMRRLPLTYPRSLLPVVRKHLENTHGKTFEEFIGEIPGRHFSEFNVLGAIADHLNVDSIRWLNTTVDDIPDVFIKQFWSWGGLTDEISKQIEEILI